MTVSMRKKFNPFLRRFNEEKEAEGARGVHGGPTAILIAPAPRFFLHVSRRIGFGIKPGESKVVCGALLLGAQVLFLLYRTSFLATGVVADHRELGSWAARVKRLMWHQTTRRRCH